MLRKVGVTSTGSPSGPGPSPGAAVSSEHPDVPPASATEDFDGSGQLAGRAVVDQLPRHGTPAADRRLLDELAGSLGVDLEAVAAVPPAAAAVAVRRIRSLIARAAELETRVTIDDLTGALRRGPGLRALAHEIARARRIGIGLAVAFIDVDGLKIVNDTAGHAAGDEVLRAVASTIRRGLRSYDLIIRYGGDEFVCALLGADLAGAERLLGEVRDAVIAATGGVSISVGLAQLAGDETVDALMARADRALLAWRRDRRPSSRTTNGARPA